MTASALNRLDERAAEPSSLHAFKLDREGLARVFGELEATVMDAVWTQGEASVLQVADALGDGSHYKTVMTVMNRLVDKGVLERRRRSRAFVYRARETREAFRARVSQRVVEGLLRDFGDVAVAQFVETLEGVDPRLLARLRRLVDAHEGGVPGAPPRSGDAAGKAGE